MYSARGLNRLYRLSLALVNDIRALGTERITANSDDAWDLAVLLDYIERLRWGCVPERNRTLPAIIGDYTPVFPHGDWVYWDAADWSPVIDDAWLLPIDEDGAVVGIAPVCPRLRGTTEGLETHSGADAPEELAEAMGPDDLVDDHSFGPLAGTLRDLVFSRAIGSMRNKRSVHTSTTAGFCTASGPAGTSIVSRSRPSEIGSSALWTTTQQIL